LQAKVKYRCTAGLRTQNIGRNISYNLDWTVYDNFENCVPWFTMLHQQCLCDGYASDMILFSMLINQSLLFLLVQTGVFWSTLWTAVFFILMVI